MFQLNQTYFSFTLQEIRELEDIHSKAYVFYHKPSGARLLYLKNDDKNKVFNVAFKTPPSDDCGTAHILEHSVLCGSRKYEAKDPFNELAKGSLNTFLNAMTYADKTMYPVASCNDKDFYNLMDVYLDAVFFPKIYEKKEIFQQEGWRYVLQNDELDITGVVYNEMKGALSDPESLLSQVIAKSVFGETTYGFESGGDPKAIPNLTYEEFLHFHQKFYHPSNSYFYLYGDMDPMACLEHIHNGYLSDFEMQSDIPVIQETTFNNTNTVLFDSYPISEDSEENGTYLAYTFKAGKCTDPEKIMALQILSYVLLESNASPLKNKLLEAGICEETEGWFDSSTYEMLFSIIAKNASPDKIDLFRSIIEKECSSLVQNGLPDDLLQGALRKYDFLLREEDYGSTPKGLIYCAKLMKNWLHEENPCDSLYPLRTIETLKKESKNRYFETLLEETFVKNPDRISFVFSPEKGKGQKEADSFYKMLQQRRKEMSETEINLIKTDEAHLEIFQKQEDTPEVLSQIPLLDISEIDSKPQMIKHNIEELKNGNPYIYVPTESKGIVYLKILFNTSSIPQELLPYTGLLAEFIGKLDTEQYSYQQLPNRLNQVFGGFSLHNTVYTKNEKEYRSFVTVKMKLLTGDIGKAFQMLEEVLFHTDFDSVENMKKIIKSEKIKSENILLNNSHYFAIYHSGSNLFSGLRIEDITNGIGYYRFLCDISSRIETDQDSVLSKLKECFRILFTEENAEAAVCCENRYKDVIKEQIEKLPFCHSCSVQQTYDLSLQPSRTAFTGTGGVVYNVTSFDYRKKGITYSGHFKVLQTIINLEFLWNKIRVQGGAYGCGCKFLRSGFSYFYSYRDPNLENTYEIYQNISEMISEFHADKREMKKYIIGTINDLDQPKTDMEKLNTVIGNYYKDITDEMITQERHEILQTSADDICNCVDLLNEINLNNICTIGSEQIINHSSEYFETIKPLI